MTVDVPQNLQAEADRLIEAVLAVVHSHTAQDFSSYKEAAIRRRIQNRMAATGAQTLESYLALLRSSRSEAATLAEQMIVKVSSFYRDARAFDVVRFEVLPRLVLSHGTESLRIWSAGCGNGEEAYTLAMLLEDQRLPGYVCATDMDEAALSIARTGVYRSEATSELPEELSRAWLRSAAPDQTTDVAVHCSVRSRVTFAIHNVLSLLRPDPLPFHLICCRNVLIYLKREEQQRVLRHLRSALAPRGFLFLGEAEWPTGAEPLFARHPSGARVFQALT
jgi:chemotaxis methyl-accepting protein methylase